jgi:hypothetical protein
MRYKAFGLVCESELELPELIQVDDHESLDVEISQGTVPTSIQGEVLSKGLNHEANQDEMLYVVPDLATYYVTNGNRIVIETKPGADNDSVRLFLLGPAFGIILHQRKVLPLHSSSIETPNGAVLFVGRRGVGKSTTASMFQKRGYRLIADDISVVRLNDHDELEAVPGFPQQKLWRDSVAIVHGNDNHFRPLRPHVEKYAVPTRENFALEPVKVFAVYRLMHAVEGKPMFAPIKGLNGISAIISQIYWDELPQRLQLEQLHFKFGLQLMQQARVRVARRPKNTDLAISFLNALEEDFLELTLD